MLVELKKIELMNKKKYHGPLPTSLASNNAIYESLCAEWFGYCAAT